MGTDVGADLFGRNTTGGRRYVNYRDYYGTWQEHPDVKAKLDEFEAGLGALRQDNAEKAKPVTLGDGTFAITQTDHAQGRGGGPDMTSLSDEQRANLDVWRENIYDPASTRYGPSSKYVGLMDKQQGMTYPEYQEKVAQADAANQAAAEAKAQREAHYQHLQDVLMAQREAIATERSKAGAQTATPAANTADDEARAKRRLLARLQGGAGTTRTSANGASGTAKVKKKTLGGA